MSSLSPNSDIYIDVPLDTDPQDLLSECYAYLAAAIPGWTPAQGNLDVWLLMAISAIAAETRDVASLVPASIFRWFGANIVGINPIDAVNATTTTTWTMVDSNGYTIPAGTQVAIPVSGATSVPFITTIDVVVAPGSTVVNGVSIQAVDPGAAANGIGTVGGTVQLLDALTFVASVTEDAVPTDGLDAELDSTYLNRLAAELQLLAPRPILARDFAIYSRNVAGVYRAAALDGYNPYHNLLSANDASLETSIGDWINNANATLTWDATWGLDGTHSLKLSSIAAGDMSAKLANAGQVAAVPGDTYTALATAKPASARTVYVSLSWLDATHALISTTDGVHTAIGAGVVTPLSVVGVAPAGTAFVGVRVTVLATGGIGENANFDKMSIRHGITGTTDWVAGGTGETNQPRTVTVAATDINGAAIDGTVKTALQSYLAAAREVNFVVNVIDPEINSIDVTVSVKAQPSADTTAIGIAVQNAIDSYLSPLAWGNFSGENPQDWNVITGLRYLGLIAAIGDASGVEYVESLTFGLHGGALGTADMTLPGAIPLVTPGTLTVTVDA